MTSFLANTKAAVLRWFDTSVDPPPATTEARVDWLRTLPFLILHLACLLALWTGVSATALWICGASYVVRMFAITGFYHRYFSHRSFKTSRAWQFVFALVGATAVQRGPLWWAAHHRRHHRCADGPDDPHSPKEHGLLWSHVGWITSKKYFATDLELVPDLARYPELRFLDRFDTLVPFVFALALYALGAVLERFAPGLGTNGWQLVVWGFFVSTVVLFHATCTINSIAHRFGRRPFATHDESRNNAFLALITLGEGWHNNHHHYPHCAAQGFRWFEFDPTYAVLRALAAIGVIRELRPVPVELRRARRDA
ncbi:MAG: acyl-CoA desaturase [Planctomycetes bacterium]|nr:acyl-CoA desaturase [Planctomycetota bacterium]